MIISESDKSNEKLVSIDWDFSNSDKSHSIHSIHPYPAKFIPEIPRKIIENVDVPEGTAILDPFCGSGVTLVEAQKAGYDSFGVDLNPIACLISKIKTMHSLPDQLDDVAQNIIKCSRSISNVTIPDLPNIDHWFQKDVQLALASLVKEINLLDEASTKQIMQVALSSIIVRVSNQESDTRYAAIKKEVNYDSVFKLFKGSVDRIIKHKLNNSLQAQSTILNKNILTLNAEDITKPIGLVVTSPPYPNAYEYWLYHKYRMWWLGFDPLYVKKNEIGARAHYFKKNHQTVDDFVLQMTQIFKTLETLLVKGGKVIMVTGNSKIHGEIVDNEMIIARTGESAGLELVDIISRNMDSNRKAFNLKHARIKKEHLVILEK